MIAQIVIQLVAFLVVAYTVWTVARQPESAKKRPAMAAPPTAPFYVGGNPEAYEREARALAGVAEDNPYWRAVVLVGAAVQKTILAAAMNAPTDADRLRLLAEARGAGRLLEELAAKRAAKG